MTVSYQWSIRRVEHPPFTDPATGTVYQDVVQVLHWACTATDGVNTATGVGSVPIQWDRSVEVFTPFASLTKAQVATWAQSNINASGRQTVAGIKASLAAQLAAMATSASTDTPAWN